MNFKSIKIVDSVLCNLVFSISNAESNELRDALAVVDKYKNAAIFVVKSKKKYDVRTSDWHMVDYCVKDDVVIISVKDGMAG